MGASWADASYILQLWIYIELFKSHVGASGLDLGYHLLMCCGALHWLC